MIKLKGYADVDYLANTPEYDDVSDEMQQVYERDEYLFDDFMQDPSNNDKKEQIIDIIDKAINTIDDKWIKKY